MSINAGMDMVMVPERYQEFIAKLKESAQDGTVPMTRIDDAVRRILRVKFAMGLMDKNHSQLADRDSVEAVRLAGAPRGGARRRARSRWCC